MTAPDNKKTAEELIRKLMQTAGTGMLTTMPEWEYVADFILANYVSKQDFERYAAHDTGCPREMRGHDDGQCDCVCDCGLSKLKSGGAGR